MMTMKKRGKVESLSISDLISDGGSACLGIHDQSHEKR
jgi:hypothetical protein